GIGPGVLRDLPGWRAPDLPGSVVGVGPRARAGEHAPAARRARGDRAAGYCRRGARGGRGTGHGPRCRAASQGQRSDRRDHQLDGAHEVLRPPRRAAVAQLPAHPGRDATARDPAGAEQGAWMNDGRIPPHGVLDTERADEAFRGLDAWSASDIISAITDSNQRAIDAVARALPELERAAAGIERCLAAGGRLVYAGAGTSGRLGVMDAAELAPTFGFDDVAMVLAGGGEAQTKAQEGAEDDLRDAVTQIDELGLGSADALIGVAASGRTPFTVTAVRHARQRGAFTVGIANNPGTLLLEAGDVGVLLDTGPEVLAGSTRLAAGTAQKAALNAL